METIEDVVNRYQEENSNIFHYALHTILAFERDKKIVVEGVTDNESIKEMLNELEFDMSNVGEKEERNQQIIEKMKSLILAEKKRVSDYLDENEKKKIPIELQNLEIVSDGTGLVQYLSFDYYETSYEEYEQELYKMSPATLKEEIDSTSGSEQYYSQFSVNDYDLLLQYARIYHYNRHIDDMWSHELYLNDMLNSYHIMDYKHQLNIFRQSFILLLTAFDAAVFDIIEVIIKENFFEFVKANDDINENYKLKDIVQIGSFEKFKDSIIDKILKSNYAAGLLRMLHKYNKNYFIVDDEDYYEKICEIIARRNLHIHKRGIIDQAYFEQSRGNPYKLERGNLAYIRGSYYLETMTVLLEILNNFQEIYKQAKGIEE